MAKRTKKPKLKPKPKRMPRVAGGVIQVHERAPPKPEDFERARNHLLRRANALVVELGEQYQAALAEELTEVLNAIDSVEDLEKMSR
jgi:hypothetical protein